MAKRKSKAQRIYDRVRVGDEIYVLNRHDYIFPPTMKKVKVVNKSYIDFGGYSKHFYLKYGRGYKINLRREEVYTSKNKFHKAYTNAYREHIKRRSARRNEMLKAIKKMDKEIPSKKANLRRLEKKYGIR